MTAVTFNAVGIPRTGRIPADQIAQREKAKMGATETIQQEVGSAIQALAEELGAEVTVTAYDANGEAIDIPVSNVSEEQGELPGIPSAGIWGDYGGKRVTRMMLGFGGGPDAPMELAGRLGLGNSVRLNVYATVSSNGFKRDKETRLPYGTASLHIEDVSVVDIEENVNDAVSDFASFIVRARDLKARIDADPGGNTEEAEATDSAVVALIDELAALYENEPFEEEVEPEGSPLDQSLADAMAEA